MRVLAAYGDDMMRVESFDAVDNDGVGACVGRAVTTVRYPPSRSVAVEVTASWTAGRLSLSARTRPYTRFPD